MTGKAPDRRSGAASASSSPATPASRAPGSRSGCTVSAPTSPGSRSPPTEPSLYALVGLDATIASRIADLRDADAVAAAVREARPQIVFHLAAQALVRASYREPLATFATNTMGTAHLLEALRDAPDVRVAVVVTTDKVYRNREWAYPYREDDALGGHDPYSASKAAAELVAASYRSAFLQAQGIAVATARAGNVIGGGDWSEDRLDPRRRARVVDRRGAARAPRRRDAAVAARARSARRLPAPRRGAVAVARARRCLQLRPAHRRGGDGRRRRSRSRAPRTAAASGGDAEEGAPHEAGRLALEVARARDELGVAARWTLAEAIDRTMRWYRRPPTARRRSRCAEPTSTITRRCRTAPPWRDAIDRTGATRHEPTRRRGHADRRPEARPPPAARRCARLSRPRCSAPTSCATPAGPCRSRRSTTRGPCSAAAFAACTSSGRRTPRRSSSTACAARSGTSPSTCAAARRPSCAGTPSG